MLSLTLDELLFWAYQFAFDNHFEWHRIVAADAALGISALVALIYVTSEAM